MVDEVILQSIDQDGTGMGLDLKILNRFKKKHPQNYRENRTNNSTK